MSLRFANNPLDVLDAKFRHLSQTDRRIGVDGRSIHAELPQRFIGATELRAMLLHPSVSYEARDAVFTFVLEKSQIDDRWTVVLLGLLVPGLKRAAGRLARGNEAVDIEAELIAGVLERSIRDVGTSRQAAKLVGAAVTYARLAIRANQREAKAIDRLYDVSGPLSELQEVLDRAVRAALITDNEAELISQTRVFGMDLPLLARSVGMDPGTLRRRRNRAEKRLRPFLEAARRDA